MFRKYSFYAQRKRQAADKLVQNILERCWEITARKAVQKCSLQLVCTALSFPFRSNHHLTFLLCAKSWFLLVVPKHLQLQIHYLDRSVGTCPSTVWTYHGYKLISKVLPWSMLIMGGKTFNLGLLIMKHLFLLEDFIWEMRKILLLYLEMYMYFLKNLVHIFWVSCSSNLFNSLICFAYAQRKSFFHPTHVFAGVL